MKQKLTLVLLVLGLHAHAQTANTYDVVIDEIMADPTPPVALPNTEFIELKNVSTQAFNLNGWRIGDAGGAGIININFILQPDSFVLICSSSAAAALRAFGPTIGISNFPSLDNDGDQLYLRSKEGKLIHAVNYSVAWYKNPVKNQGGWTLEMIDTKNPCSGIGNWMASADATGGTPARKNSVDAINKDTDAPSLLSAFAADSMHVILNFDEPLDSLQASNAANYLIDKGIGNPQLAQAIPPVFTQVQLTTSTLLSTNNIYRITATAITDCAGNSIGQYRSVKLGKATMAKQFDVVINEILFNPRPDGVDYIELYNRSNIIIDLKDCYVANRSAIGLIGSLKQISTSSRLLFPGDYLVITSDADAVARQYLAKDPAAFAVLSSMPSMPDDKGDVLILNTHGAIIDELNYDAHWQFKLLADNEGVALERISYNNATQDASNWHSAATNVGYGTPGYQNSQFTINAQLPGTITIDPLIFSPDNDGLNDFLTINYQFPEPGYVCNISIVDASGRPVRLLTHNALCGIQGYFRWDGLDEKNARLPIGIYVVFSEVFNLQGKTKRFKQAVTLARRLN